MLEPQTTVVRIAWKTEKISQSVGWRKWLARFWDGQERSVFIVDEAQSLYWDMDFLTGLKSIDRDSEYRLITFASYGSSGRGDVFGIIPYSPFQTQAVGLRAIDYGDQIEVGLLLTKPEFYDFVEKRFSGNRFDKDFLDSIYDLTAGHVGACEDVLKVIRANDVSPYPGSAPLTNLILYMTVISLSKFQWLPLHLRDFQRRNSCGLSVR
jgi:hypothetical protein